MALCSSVCRWSTLILLDLRMSDLEENWWWWGGRFRVFDC